MPTGMKAQTRLSAVEFPILSTIKQALVCEWAVSRWAPSTLQFRCHSLATENGAHDKKEKRIKCRSNQSSSDSQGTVTSTPGAPGLHFGMLFRHLAGRG